MIRGHEVVLGWNLNPGNLALGLAFITAIYRELALGEEKWGAT